MRKRSFHTDGGILILFLFPKIRYQKYCIVCKFFLEEERHFFSISPSPVSHSDYKRGMCLSVYLFFLFSLIAFFLSSSPFSILFPSPLPSLTSYCSASVPFFFFCRPSQARGGKEKGRSIPVRFEESLPLPPPPLGRFSRSHDQNVGPGATFGPRTEAFPPPGRS